MAPKTFPEATPSTAGLTRVLLKKAFFDPADAVRTLQGIPKDDLLRILSVIVPPSLSSAYAEMVAEWEQVDLALLATGFCNSFHSGYSTCITDVTKQNPSSLHQEYVDEQQRNANTGSAAIASAASRPNP